SFSRAQQRYAGFLGDLRPMVLGNVLRSRGTRPFYRVLVPEASRAAADQVCQAILSRGGACVTVRT
ncbi:MAG TPA: SPOR domain-containing protein, partial [Stellaceae bacterium]|nr:SPOR domain-containing protein [Stellaceae bacterium]